MNDDYKHSIFSDLPISEAQSNLISTARLQCKGLERLLNDNIEGSRYKSICITKLEELNMYINKAISRNFRQC
jgi:hypothetical protein